MGLYDGSTPTDDDDRPASSVVQNKDRLDSLQRSRMTRRIVSLLLFVVAPLAAVASWSPKNSDVTLLYQNDLNVNTAAQHKSSLYLSTLYRSADAASACQTYNEGLLPVDKAYFGGDLKSSLSYLVYQGHLHRGQELWVAPKGMQCQSVDTYGHVSSTSCYRALPVLCSQSAPFMSPPSATDRSSKYWVKVQAGDLAVTGYRDQLSFRFLGVKYAAQPERFAYSKLLSGPRKVNATDYGAQCIQGGCSGTTCSEDCLFLNIFTSYLPTSGHVPKKMLKPVMFWIHGGAFTGGTGSDQTVDGGNSASRGDVVIVTINYRLSTLGFLALGNGVTNGNYGLADQIVALDWVRKYITSFGGDPDRITIFGQSAGAASVRALMASPMAIGKYAAAIPMSNLAGSNYATTYSLYYTIPQEVAAAANPILALTGCNTTADPLPCLRAYDAQSLVQLSTVARYLVVDGKYLTSNGLPLNGAGATAHVHTMMGFMRDDGAPFFSFANETNLTQALLDAYLPPTIATTSAGTALFPEPHTAAGPAWDAFNVSSRVTTDLEFRCLDQATAYAATAHGLLRNLYFYEFNRSYQMFGWDPNKPACDAPITASHPAGDPNGEYYKCHSGELFYVFGNLLQPLRDDNDLLFEQMANDAWTSFARTWDPNSDEGYLMARGYRGTLERQRKDGRWMPVTKANYKSGKPLRVLQVPEVQSGWGEVAQCEYLGYGLDYYV